MPMTWLCSCANLLDASNTLARLRAAAGRRALERDSLEAVADHYEAYFAELIAGDNTPR